MFERYSLICDGFWDRFRLLKFVIPRSRMILNTIDKLRSEKYRPYSLDPTLFCTERSIAKTQNGLIRRFKNTSRARFFRNFFFNIEGFWFILQSYFFLHYYESPWISIRFIIAIRFMIIAKNISDFISFLINFDSIPHFCRKSLNTNSWRLLLTHVCYWRISSKE